MKKTLSLIISLLVVLSAFYIIPMSAMAEDDCPNAQNGKHEWRTSYREANCVMGGLRISQCTRCGKVVETTTEKDENKHIWSDYTILKYPTCTENGIAQCYCLGCGKQVTVYDNSDDQSKPKIDCLRKLGHIEVKDNKFVEPTCTENGRYGQCYCSRCHAWLYSYSDKRVDSEGFVRYYGEKLYTYTEVIPPKGHNYRYVGYSYEDHEYLYVCDECGEQKPFGTCNHVPSEKVVRDYITKPTCEKEGTCKESVYCKKCSKCLYETTVAVPKLEHEYRLDYINTNPTCTTDGSATYECCNCGKTKKVKLSALGHVEKVVSGIAATCAKEGRSDYKVCERCGINITNPTTIPKLNTHSLKTVKVQDATCSSDGNIEYQVCTKCNKIFVNEVETDKGDVIIERKQHNLSVINQKDASYTREGYTGDIYCSNCNKIIFKGKNIEKIKLDTPKLSASLCRQKSKVNLKVKYKYVDDATGFQVKYKQGATWITKTYKSDCTITKIVKKKLAYKKLQIKIRVFTKENEQTVYSNWSKTKTFTSKDILYLVA